MSAAYPDLIAYAFAKQNWIVQFALFEYGERLICHIGTQHI